MKRCGATNSRQETIKDGLRTRPVSDRINDVTGRESHWHGQLFAVDAPRIASQHPSVLPVGACADLVEPPFLSGHVALIAAPRLTGLNHRADSDGGRARLAAVLQLQIRLEHR